MAECKDCDYFDKEQTYGSIWDSVKKYKCKQKSGSWDSDEAYVYADDTPCRYFKEKGSSDCYITTIVCHILGYKDDCELLQTLRNFRDNYMKKHLDDKEILFLLKEYDILGPEISKKIWREKNNYVLCSGLYKYFLTPCALAIKEEKYEEAINIYKNMVIHLHDSYNLPYLSIDLNESYDIELLGKARNRQRYSN